MNEVRLRLEYLQERIKYYDEMPSKPQLLDEIELLIKILKEQDDV